ncbi:MFS transporter [Ruficoccus amylovorans]|uniref:MFS transporter n=1 Tax=Ruficoccus amylovorans TaxID=1804625 RepID=A0A842HD34_9BACT|nr:MFS transporter [Ruficoccus amylovorans]MBC2593454.1 MFS transporter [Ruficoccus amylovorans]
MMKPMSHKPAGLARIFGYAMGEGGISIAMNGVSNFALIFLTQVLGLGAGVAALALSITTLWDAITDPLMGYISDNTRTRLGRRQPYLLIGSLALAVSFFLLWFVPQQVTGEAAVFAVVLCINLLLRTAVTVFAVPFTALGFEICPDYEGRSRLQGVRFFINQVVNFTFGAMAWTLFFRDEFSAEGERIDGTLIAGNYLLMGAVLAMAVLIMSLICIVSTWQYAKPYDDEVGDAGNSRSVAGFVREFGSILRDRLALWVFGFFVVAQFAMLLTAQMQLFTYVFFMEFSSSEKTFVHGAGMLSFAVCSLFQSRLVARFDKKVCGYIGGGLSFFGGVGLYLVFIGGVLPADSTWTVGGVAIPLSVGVFALLQSCWWGGGGVLVPLASSMIADVAAINYVNTGKLKNASYASVFTFCQKTSISIGLLLTGWLVATAGIESGADEQTPEAVRNIATLTFISGPVVIALALFILGRYPVDRAYMDDINRRTEEMEAKMKT